MRFYTYLGGLVQAHWISGWTGEESVNWYDGAVLLYVYY